MNNDVFIRTEGLRKAFQMGRQTVLAVDNLDLDIPRNSFTIIMGPSGSGKSTLLYLLGGLTVHQVGVSAWPGSRSKRWTKIIWPCIDAVR